MIIGLPLEEAREILEREGFRVVRVRVLPHYHGGQGRGELMVVKVLVAEGENVEMWCCEKPPGPRGFLNK